jgi:HPr kinase/phosphorylase
VTSAAAQIHATCVALDEGAVLLRGPSGAGKSDLALRLIDGGARLVADDRVDVERRGDALIARAPAPLVGLLEIRGVGIVSMPHVAAARISLVVDLVPRAAVERLPEDMWEEMLGLPVPRLALDPFDGSTAVKIRVALRVQVARAVAKPAA